MFDISSLKFDENGYIIAVSQCWQSGSVLMVGVMNEEAARKTIETGKVHYYSRSRKNLWLKGETSGNFQNFKEMRYNCENNSLLILAEQVGVACHTGEYSCYYRTIGEPGEQGQTGGIAETLARLYSKIEDRRANPVEGSYTNTLFEKGLDVMLKKIGEESAEVVIAAKNGSKPELVWEIADLLYHLSVVMVNGGVGWDDIAGELNRRYSQLSQKRA
jgi:phosphoribosyl-ATP pyrophosphohydrolase/phosphoribosyl-AMP cyclohydrolase